MGAVVTMTSFRMIYVIHLFFICASANWMMVDDRGIPRFHYFKDDGKVKWSVDDIYINREKKVPNIQDQDIFTKPYFIKSGNENAEIKAPETSSLNTQNGNAFDIIDNKSEEKMNSE